MVMSVEPQQPSQPSPSEASEPRRKPQMTRSALPEKLDTSLLFILATIALTAGMIVFRPAVNYTVNDASRWATVYYLVEHGTYEFLPDIDTYWRTRSGNAIWDVPVLSTIDMIKIGDHYYSSKPPLLPTCLAGFVWVLQEITGDTFHNNPTFFTRSALLAFQVLPLGVALFLLRSYFRRVTDSEFVVTFAVAAASLGTYLTAWAITLNNHVIAASTSMIALYAALRIWYDGDRRWYWFALAGFFAALTASVELPAGLLAVGLFVGLLMKAPSRTLTIGLISAAIPTAAALYTNYLVTGSIVPAYASFSEEAGWYQYPGSYWNAPQSVDALDEPKSVYLFHMLLGHEGFFTLTPLFFICAIGLLSHLIAGDGRRPVLAWSVLVMFASVVAVYTFKTNNYGGGCQGYRWLFWLIPSWLLFLPRGLELLAVRRSARIFCYFFFLVSVFSVGYAILNPWTKPWTRWWFQGIEWISY